MLKLSQFDYNCLCFFISSIRRRRRKRKRRRIREELFSYSSLLLSLLLSSLIFSSSCSPSSLLLLLLLTFFSFILQICFMGVMHTWSGASSLVVQLFVLRLVLFMCLRLVMQLFDTCVHYVYRSLDLHYVFGDYIWIT